MAWRDLKHCWREGEGVEKRRETVEKKGETKKKHKGRPSFIEVKRGGRKGVLGMPLHPDGVSFTTRKMRVYSWRTQGRPRGAFASVTFFEISDFFLKSARCRASVPRPHPFDTNFEVRLGTYGDNLGIRTVGPVVVRLD